MKSEIIRKIEMVRELGQTLINYIHGVADVNYQVFVDDIDAFNSDKSCAVREYLIVTFNNGAISVRNCTGDSFSAIVGEIAARVNGGYYDEVNDYIKYYRDNPAWIDISINSNRVNLPEEVFVGFENMVYEETMDEDELNMQLIEYLDNAYGVEVQCFDYDILCNGIMIKNIEWYAE